MKVLIAGCGDLGGRIGRILAGRGARVHGMRRSVERLPVEILPIAADMTVAPLESLVPEDIEVLFYTASAGGRDEAAYRAAYLTGLSRVLAAVRQKCPHLRQVLFSSSTSVYHQGGGAEVDETSPTEPTRFSGRILLEAEQLVRESGYAHCVVRLSGIYGPGRFWLLRSIRDGAAYAETPVVYSNRIHIEDAARFMAFLAGHEAAEPLYICSDGSPAPMAEIAAWLRARMAADGIALAPVGAGSSPGRANRRCRNTRMLQTGFEPAYPDYQAGYSALWDQWRRAQ
ncbi:NAD-dependent epimerase/dehydratase family protein [Acanthopleuribacter pedis]|uniref:Sugar nucleotide-binding protein n=1 Tax=Acanthopleuribacter pedis TaxID=442870 RepID=A0A8J7QHQ2_9BACT|nr:NAD-dependent epimerase/dehydratase family protein [Acanthopleuribacter pedis]MBO1322665.1 sugar nucleotide-binding protein [Acanthopleuribacter pedis]